MKTILHRNVAGMDMTSAFVKKIFTDHLADLSGYTLFCEGGLGAGKTFAIRELLSLYGVKENVVSPTYVYVHEYEIDGKKLAHFDFYRLPDPQEFFARGFEEIASDPDTICLVEWPEKISPQAKAAFSAPALTLKIKHGLGASLRDLYLLGEKV